MRKKEDIGIMSDQEDDNCKMELLDNMPEEERYKFIGKLKSSTNIAVALNNLGNDTIRSKTFRFVAKQFKGNNVGLLQILSKIDFEVTIPSNMLCFKLNNMNELNLDLLLNIQRHVSNYTQIRFMINEYESDSTDIEYSFSEISAIIAKIEELTTDIPNDMDEANRFFQVYSRITGMMTYDYECLRKSDHAEDERKKVMYKEGYIKASEQYDKEIKK